MPSDFDELEPAEQHDDLAAGDDPSGLPTVAAAALLGYHSEEDVAAYERAVTYFKHFDKDGNGVIDRDEFKSLHADLVKNKVTEKNLQDSWTELDADGDGSITHNEYLDWLVRVGSLRPPSSPQSSRRSSFNFHIEEYPYQMAGEEQSLYAAPRRGTAYNTPSQSVESKASEQKV